MLSLILPALSDEPATLETLATLVEGVAVGILRDCVLVSATSSEMLERYADAAGCLFVVEAGTRDALIQKGAAHVRSEWSLIITPGLVPSGDWLNELADWMSDKPAPTDAAFLPFHSRRGWIERLNAMRINIMPQITGRTDPLQGSVISTALLRQGPLPRLTMTRLNARLVDRRVAANS